MLTDAQKRYLLTIPEPSIVKVDPWDPKASQLAKKLIEKVNNAFPDLEVFWSGALALGISGQNDIDLSILGSPQDFEQYLPKLISILGEPQRKSKENIMWRTNIGGYKVDAYLGDKDSESIKLHKTIFELLNNNSNLLEEYRLLKEKAGGLPFREYQSRKYEFYNRILGL